MKEPEEYWSMINDSKISENKGCCTNDLAKTCTAIFASVIHGFNDEMAENLEPENIPNPLNVKRLRGINK